MKERPKDGGGSMVHLSAKGSTDPDGDQLTFNWWYYSEVSDFSGDIEIKNADKRDASIVLPDNISKEVNLHIICEVKDDGIWSKPEIIHFSGTEYMDMYPFLSYDGTTLYFQSNRPLDLLSEEKSFNIWTSTLINGKWTNPQPLRNIFNDTIEVSGISIAKSGNIYYTLISEEKQEIFRIRKEGGKYLDPEKLPKAVNSAEFQFDGVIAADESYMILGVYGKDDSFGSTDLYVTFRNEDDSWSEVVNLGKDFNTKYTEGRATITADGKYIFFGGYLAKNNWMNDTLSYDDILNFQIKSGSGNSDIYWVSSEVLEKYRE